MADKSVIEQAIIELQSVYKGGGAKKAKKDLADLEKQLENSNGSVKRLQNALKQLNNVPIAFDDGRSLRGGKRGDAISQANTALKKYFSTIQTGARQLAATEAGLRAQAAAFDRIAANSKIATANSKKGGEIYVGAVNSQVRAEQKLRLAQIERLKVEQQLYSTGRLQKNDAFKGVEELLTYGKTLPQTTAALSVYKNELQKTLGIVEIGGEKYKKLRAEIKSVEEIMKGPKAERQPGLAGLAEGLEEAKKKQSELKVGTDDWEKAVIRVKKAQFQYNLELAKSRVVSGVINADISGTVRVLNLAKQAAKGGLGLIAGAGKKALGTRFGQIGAARGIDALVKKVPILDRAFGRLVQKVPLFGRFLNENISVNARWAAQILEGITGATIAWNGLNQIISGAQAFTAFERQAAVAINRVTRSIKEMYNVAGAMMMGFMSPGQVAKNTWDQVNDRPEVLEARHGPRGLRSLEEGLADKQAKLRNTELSATSDIEKLTRQVLEHEIGISREVQARAFQRAKENPMLRTQYGSPIGPGGGGLEGWRSGVQGSATKSMEAGLLKPAQQLLSTEQKITIEIRKQEQLMRTLRQGVENVNLSAEEQRALFGTDNKSALAAQREMATTQSPIAQRWGDRSRTSVNRSRGPISNEAWARYQRRKEYRRQSNQRFRENMMLGAGFPMLFGGGVGGVGGGMLGAYAQKKMGTKGGFGAQILLSALGQKFDQIVGQMIASTTKLAQATNQYVADIGELTRSLGLVNTAEGQRLRLIEQTEGKQAAFNEAMKQLSFQVGDRGVQALKSFGDKSIALSNAWNRFTTGVWASIAKLLEKLGVMDGVTGALNYATKGKTVTKNMMIEYGNEDQKERAKRGLQLENEIGSLSKERDAYTKSNVSIVMNAKRIKQIQELIALKREELKVHESILAVDFIEIQQSQQLEAIQNSVLNDINEQNEVYKNQLKYGVERGNLETEITKRIKEAKDLAGEGVDINEKAIRLAVEENHELKEQVELWTKIKDTLASGITNAITGLIQGTKTLGESLSGIIGQIGQIFMQTAISKWVGGWSMFSGKGGKGAAEGSYNTAGGFKAFAQGGVTTGPTLGLIGEAGEPEYVIPASKMEGAMGRYSAGARGQAVIPGGGTVASGSGVYGGSVQIDYTGPILSFNSEDYVPKSAVPEIINRAARRGAEAGQTQVFSQLKNSRSQRSRIGL